MFSTLYLFYTEDKAGVFKSAKDAAPSRLSWQSACMTCICSINL